MKRLMLVALAFLTTLGATFSGGGINTPSAGAVVAAFDCESIGQSTLADGGSLTIKYGDTIQCQASRSTVNGIGVNGSDANWTKDVFFEWDWDDSSLGSVTRGGLTTSLGVSVSLVASHAFLPTVFSETCGGGTNSLHTVTLRVSSPAGTDTATASLCVENPLTTWPTPVAFCDDANCADDAGVPAGTVHGGNGTALGTILDYCDANGSEWILVEGGVTFTATGLTNVGVNRCFIQSYGAGGRAIFDFTSTSSTPGLISPDSANCAPFVLNEIKFSGNGGGHLFGTEGTDPDGIGCLSVIGAELDDATGNAFLSFANLRAGGALGTGNGLVQHIHMFKVDIDDPDNLVSSAGTTSFYIHGEFTSIVGSQFRDTNQNNLRFGQWDWLTLDANILENPNETDGNAIVFFRQNCGDPTTCNKQTEAQYAGITRNEVISRDDNPNNITYAFEFGHDGNGSGEPTREWDIDLVRNLFTSNQATGDFVTTARTIDLQLDDVNAEFKRVRFIQNAADLSAYDSSTATRTSLMSLSTLSGTARDLWFDGNVIYCGDTCNAGTAYKILDANFTGMDARNNVCLKIGGTGSCNLFPTFAEDSTNKTFTATPFTGTPGVGPNFDFTDLVPADAGGLDGTGGASAPPTDVNGDVRPQGTTDPGVQEIP